MPIEFLCAGCSQKLKAKEVMAGKTVACPKCSKPVRIPHPPAKQEDALDFLLNEDSPHPVTASHAKNDGYSEAPEPEPNPPKKPIRKVSTPAQKAQPGPAVGALVSKENPFWLRNLHWLLVLALLPLAISVLKPSSDSLDSKLISTLKDATPEQAGKLVAALESDPDKGGGVEKFFSMLPGQKFSGALLARNSLAHWGFGLASMLLFLGFFAFLAKTGSANPIHLLAIGLATATAGILLLLIFQVLADWSQNYMMVGRSILVVIFYIIKLIGLSYRMALDPEYGFLPSFLGFTLGVGLCEELVKIIPVLFRLQDHKTLTWHGAFLWGLASGAGFGISEAIMYSANYYNGVSGWETYLVRFTSCIALHALWTGIAAILVFQFQHLFFQVDSWYGTIPPLLVVLGIPMILHGLYDTLLKKEMDVGALVVALVSFLILGLQNALFHGQDTAEARDELLKEYRRGKKGRA